MDDNNDIKVRLDLPINLTKMLFFYKINSVELFQHNYKQCNITKQQLTYKASLLPSPLHLQHYFPHLQSIHHNHSSTLVYGACEVILSNNISPLFIYIKIKLI